MEQTRRGLEALKMFADFLESHYGKLCLSVNESNYSSGSHGKPDLVFGEFAIEVKRVEFLSRNYFDAGQKYWLHINNLSVEHQSWNTLKEWSQKNKKKLILVAVVTFGHQDPMYVAFSQEQIDELQREQLHKRWFQTNSWKVLLNGTILKGGDPMSRIPPQRTYGSAL